MASTIKLKRGSGVPTTGTLATGEVALDLTNKKLYSSTNGSDVVEISPQATLTSLGVTSTAAELNVLDGITATTAELNILDGVTATASEINKLDGLTATTAELNYVDGVTSAIQTQLNAKPDNLADLGVTATATELNKLDGVTATTTELNYVDGVTSNIQTQLNAKAPAANPTFTGVVKVADGSASAPSLAFTNDTDLGLYKKAAGTVACVVGSSNHSFVSTLYNTLFTDNGNAISIINGGIDLSYTGSGATISIQNTGTSSSTQMAFRNGNGIVGTISTSGTATTYATSSDYRLKENLAPLTNAVDRLYSLPVYRFNFINDPSHTVDGFLAHEAQAVVPECVIGEKDAVDDNGNPIYQGIDQSKLVPLLVAAVQELSARLAILENK